MVTPLVLIPNQTRRPKSEIEPGDLITVKLFGGKESGARVSRRMAGNTWVNLAGLTAPGPYEIGDSLVIDDSAIIDW